MKKIVLFALCFLSMFPAIDGQVDPMQNFFTGRVSLISGENTIYCESKHGEVVCFSYSTDTLSFIEDEIERDDLVFITYRTSDDQLAFLIDQISPLQCIGTVRSVYEGVFEMSSVIGPLVVALPDEMSNENLENHMVCFTARSMPKEGQLFRECIIPNSDISFVSSYHGTIVDIQEGFFTLKLYAQSRESATAIFADIVENSVINVRFDAKTQCGEYPFLGEKVEVIFNETETDIMDDIYAIAIVQKIE